MVEHAFLGPHPVNGSRPDPAEAVIAKTANLAQRLARAYGDGLGPGGHLGGQVAETLLCHLVIPVLDLLEEEVRKDPLWLGPRYRACLELARAAGLERLFPIGELADPSEHGVVHRFDGVGDQPRVVQVLRPGYLWRGRVLRPATVRVQALG